MSRKTKQEEIFAFIGTVSEALKNIDVSLNDIKQQLKDGDNKFNQYADQIQAIKLECEKRGVNCPAIKGASAPSNSIPWKFIGAGIVFVAASLYGLVVILAKAFKIDLPWPF